MSRRPSLRQLVNSLISATCNRTSWTTWLSKGWLAFFLRPTPDGSRQLVYHARKYDCIVQIHQINAVATLVMMTMWVKREPELDRYGAAHWKRAQHFQCPSLRVECSLAASKACFDLSIMLCHHITLEEELFNLPSPTAPPWFLWQGNFLWSEAKSRSIENTSLRRIARTMGLLFTKAAVVVLVVQLVSHNSMTDCRTMSGRHWLSSDTEGTESLSVHGGGQRRSTLPDSEQIGNVVSEIQAERH